VERAHAVRDEVPAHEAVQRFQVALPELGPRGLIAGADLGEQDERGRELGLGLVAVLLVGTVSQGASPVGSRRRAAAWARLRMLA
jgi:hypothetical protein